MRKRRNFEPDKIPPDSKNQNITGKQGLGEKKGDLWFPASFSKSPSDGG